MRQYSGFGTAAETNQRFHFLLGAGQTGLSLRLRPAHPDGLRLRPPPRRGRGRQGRRGDRLARGHGAPARTGLPLDTVTTSMTINSTAAILLLLYELVAEKQGVPSRRRSAARSRTTCSRSTSPAAPTSTRRGRRCGSSPTSSPTAASTSRSGTRSRSPATTSARPAAPRCRRSRSRCRNGDRVRAGRDRRRASTSTSSRRACRSSGTGTTTSSKRSRSSGPRGACGTGS